MARASGPPRRRRIRPPPTTNTSGQRCRAGPPPIPLRPTAPDADRGVSRAIERPPGGFLAATSRHAKSDQRPHVAVGPAGGDNLNESPLVQGQFRCPAHAHLGSETSHGVVSPVGRTLLRVSLEGEVSPELCACASVLAANGRRLLAEDLRRLRERESVPVDELDDLAIAPYSHPSRPGDAEDVTSACASTTRPSSATAPLAQWHRRRHRRPAAPHERSRGLRHGACRNP